MVKKRQGFTLIELLVVIAIIAILAAILFPIFATARETAKVSTCINNLKQLGQAVQMYLDTSNGRYPAMISWGRVSAGSLAAGYRPQIEILGKFAKVAVARNLTDADRAFTNVGVFKCPADIGYPAILGEQGGNKPHPIKVWEQCGSSYDYVAGDQTDYEDIYPHEQTYGSGSHRVVKYSGLTASLPDATGTRRACGAPASAVRAPSRKGILSDQWNWHMSESREATRVHRNTLYADGHATRTWINEFRHSRALPLGAWFPPSEVGY